MRRIPLVSGDPALAARVEVALGQCRAGAPDVERLPTLADAVDYVHIEMPELLLLGYPDPRIDAQHLLETIRSDPWLIHGGIVALCKDEDAVERLERVRGLNLVATLDQEGLRQQLPRVLDIISDNPRILFQREIGSDLLRETAGHFKLRNDLLEARCHANLVGNFLYNANRIDGETRESLNLALYEMLVNAIEHGNCGIDYEEKSSWLASNGSMAGLLERRCSDPEIAGRRVTFEYTIHADRSRFLVADEGPGFDWKSMASVDPLELHGRGILLARSFTRGLSYNEKGNEVRFEVPHRTDEASMTPRLLEGMERREVRAGEIVFREGDPGTSMFYIAKGRYDVLVRDAKVASLRPDDIFLGEMSFLLNDRRSATVRAEVPGLLIEISKKKFVAALKERPHYALLLSRLLAQRIERANRLCGARPAEG